MLMSAGGFALYRSHLATFESLLPRFGPMEKRRNREELVKVWLQTKSFRRTGVGADVLSSRILDECRSAPDFIRIVMESVASSQGASRWALYDPDNVLYIEELKAGIPNALFLHIVRDGRDIALSLKKMGGFTPLPWDRTQTSSLVATGLFWEWMVRSGRSAGKHFPGDYLEIHYEDLVTNPHQSLQRIGAFLEHDLDYDRIQRVGLGRLSQSNSSFRDESEEKKVNPLGRWKQRLTHEQVAALEATVGECLEESGYSLSLPPSDRKLRLSNKAKRFVYRNFLNAKSWLKLNTPAGRLADLSALEIESGPTTQPE